MIYTFGQGANVIGPGSLVALDTSFVYELWGRERYPDRKAECAEFTNAVAKNKGIMIIPVQVSTELRLIVTDDVVGPRKDRKAVLANASLMPIVRRQTEALEQALFSNPAVYPEPVGVIDTSVLKRADEIAAQANAEYGDAIIAALLEQNNVTHIATLDRDFCRVSVSLPNLNIHVTRYLYKLVMAKGSAPESIPLVRASWE